MPLIVHISDRTKFKRSDSYARKMLYTFSSVFWASYEDFLRIRGDPRINKKKYVVWYENPTSQRDGRVKQNAKFSKKGR